MNSDNVITKKGFSKFTEHFPHFFNNSSNEKSTYFWKTVYSEYWLIEKYIKIGNFLASNIANLVKTILVTINLTTLFFVNCE